MIDASASLAGELAEWPTKDRMVAILANAGLKVVEGRFSIRIADCSHFVFREYGGDLGKPVIDADADTSDKLIQDAELVSGALARAGIRHRFEIYDHQSHLVGYIP